MTSEGGSDVHVVGCGGRASVEATRGSYQEDFETGDVEDSDEGGALTLGAVERLVDARHHPLEELLVNRLADRLHRVLDLQRRASTPCSAKSSVSVKKKGK